MKTLSKVRSFAVAVCLSLGVGSAHAQTDTCPDSGMYSQMKAISDLCWNCFFPIKIAGISSAGGGGGSTSFPTGNMSVDYDNSRRGANSLPEKTAAPICVCPGRMYGIPSPGITWGMWFPTHTMELTRRPWCSPTLFGMELGGTNMQGLQGISLAALDGGPPRPGGPMGGDTREGSFYNWHWLTFPVYELMESFMSSLCSPGGWGGDMSYVYFTEFDPTWDNEMLALYTHPEIKVFTNLYAKAACAADSVMSTVKRPINSAIWCAGTWGSMYPFAGKGGTNATVEAQMLAGARGLAAMHRRGLAKLTYGDRATCTDAFWFIYPKQQYQFQNMWPVPQKKNNNWTGASSWKWGQHRKIPVRAEERVILQWSYKECCYTFY